MGVKFLNPSGNLLAQHLESETHLRQYHQEVNDSVYYTGMQVWKIVSCLQTRKKSYESEELEP
jgi:hypothetical protein